MTRTARGTYVPGRGRRLSPGERKRAESLAIPPAYTDVCVHGRRADLQATARDKRGKTHYYYSPAFLRRKRKERTRRVNALSLDRVLAKTRRCSTPEEVGLRLLALTYMRPGKRKSADLEGGSPSVGAFGLRGKHLRLRRGGRICLDYVGKSGVEQSRDFVDKPLHEALRKRRLSRHEHLLDTNPRAVRDLLRTIGGDATLKLKDLRTAGAIRVYNKCMRGRADKRACHARSAVALGHSPGVNRKYYVHT